MTKREQFAGYVQYGAQTIKLPENQDQHLNGHILRLVEIAGKAAEAEIALPFLNRSFRISMKPQEIKTVFLPADGGETIETDLTEH